MAVRVDIPTTIRVDTGALYQRRRCVEEALGLAATRALVNSRDVVLAQRGGYVGVKLLQPQVTWSGDGLESLPEAYRAELEASIATLLHEAAEAAGVFDFFRSGLEASDPLSQQPTEEVDPQRVHWLLGVYQLPSYDSGGDSFVDFEEGDVFTTRDVWTVVNLQRISQDSAYQRQLLRNALLRWGRPTSGSYQGIIYEFPGGYQIVMWPVGGGARVAFGITRPTIYTIEGEGAAATWVNRSVQLPVGIVTMRHITLDEFRESLRAHLSAVLRQLAPRPDQMADAAYEQQLEAKVTPEVERSVARLPANTVSVIEVRVSGRRYWLPAGDQLQWEGEGYLLPISEREVVPVGGDGGPSGEAASDQAGGGQPGGRGEGGEEAAGGGEGQREGEGGSRRGGFVFTGRHAADDAAPAPLYPPSRYTSSGEQDCGPLLGEPALEELGSDAQVLQRLMEEIAYRLQIRPCGHAARFCLNAAHALGSRAGTVAAFATTETGFTTALDLGTANLGLLEFRPAASPAIQFMRHVAGIVPLINRLSDAIMDIYAKPANRVKISGVWGDDPPAWSLHFLMELTPAIRDSVGFIFGMSCKVLLLQLLRASRAAIDERLANLDREALKFETFIVPQLRGVLELQQLRERLREYQRLVALRRALGQAQPPTLILAPTTTITGTAPAADWTAATRAVLDAMTANYRAPTGGEVEAGQVVDDGNTVRITDSQGLLWTMDALERGIVIRRGLVESFDPLVKQLIELDEVVERLGDSRADIRTELERLLTEMKTKNEEITGKTEGSWEFAFRASKIREDLPSATIPYTSLALQGIHLQVHQQIGEFFEGDRHYAVGVDFLFSAELGRQSLTAFFEFTGLLLLAIACPPAAFAAGAASGLYHYEKAKERERLYGALMDPELVLTRAEVEVELFATRLGLALQFIPSAGAVIGRAGVTGVRLGVRGSAQAVRSSARQLLTTGARGAGRAVVQRITRSVAEQLKRGLVRAFVEELATDQFMEQLINQFMEPAIRRIEREIAITGPAGGTAGAVRTLRRLEVERQRRLSKPDERPRGEGSDG